MKTVEAVQVSCEQLIQSFFHSFSAVKLLSSIYYIVLKLYDKGVKMIFLRTKRKSLQYTGTPACLRTVIKHTTRKKSGDVVETMHLWKPCRLPAVSPKVPFL